MGVFDKASNFLFGTADNAYSDARDRQNAYNTEYQNSVNAALNPYKTLSDVGQAKSLQQQYINGLTGLNASQYKTTAPTLDVSSVSDADVKALIDPNVEYQKQSAQKALATSAAGKSGLFSSGFGKSVATSDEQLSAQAYNDAYNKALNEKNRQTQLANSSFANAMQAGQYNLGMDTANTNALGQAYNTTMEPLNAYAQGSMDLAGTLYGAKTGLSQQGMQMQGADTGYFAPLLGAGSSMASSYFGSK